MKFKAGKQRKTEENVLRTIEAVVEPDGRVRLLEDVRLEEAHRALVTILDAAEAHQDALLSEMALADWNRPEEDAAWEDLQPGR